MDKSEIVKFARKNGYYSVVKDGEWKGYEVYTPQYEDDKQRYTGLPLKILVRGKIIRMTTGVEAMNILKEFTEE